MEIKIIASKPPPITVDKIHLKKSLFSDIAFKITITLALTNEPIKYESKLPISILVVLPKTIEYALFRGLKFSVLR